MLEYNVIGTVIDISMRHSVIETLERTQVIIPNTIMNKAIIENVSMLRLKSQLFIS
ncbi:MAG: mechanosensitive ion channel domain-containing protein [Thomasclavelia ramosa]